MNHRGVTDIGLLKTHRKTTEGLEFTKEGLHQMTPLSLYTTKLCLVEGVEKRFGRPEHLPQ